MAAGADEAATPTPLYGGILPYPSQWITVFAIARDDMSALIKERTGLNISQARFLYEAGYHRHDNSMSDIANALLLQANTGTAIACSLVDLGLLSRNISKKDGRSAIVDCTDEGRDRISSIDKALLAYQDLLRSVLSRSQFDNLMEVAANPARSVGCFYEQHGRPMQMPNYLSGTSIVLSRLSAISHDEGLSLIAIRMLASIITSGSASRLSSLSMRLGIKQNVASSEASKLEAMGLAKKLPDQLDKRAIRLAPTDLGQKAFSRVTELFIESVTTSARLLRVAPGPVMAHLHHVKHA